MSKWKLVPVEPTEAMSAAAMRDFDTPFYADLERIYRCMVAAVPETDLIEVLRECEEYFDDRADAEYFPDSAALHPNEEMNLLVKVRDVLKKAGA